LLNAYRPFLNLQRVVVRSLVVALALVATLLATASSQAGQQRVGGLEVASRAPTNAVAQPAGDDGEPEGDSDDGPIDCSIPDNQDDTGCDTGDVQDGAGTPGDPGEIQAADPGGPDDVVPRGGVQGGAGGMAGRLAPGARARQAAVGASAG
jgi:hypothetical protein